MRRSASARGYTRRWDRASKGFLAENPFCRGCQALGRAVAATLTDHVIPHRGDLDLFWDSRRWQASCGWHHNQVKQRLEAMFDAGEIGEAALWLDSGPAQDIARQILAQDAGRGGSRF